MFYTIYQITDLINDKIYIGLHKTSKLDDGYMGSGKNLRVAQKQFGIENFKKEILFIFDNEKDMIDKEIELVTEEFCSREDTYNMAKGGGDGWSYANKNGLNRTEWHKVNNTEHMKKMSAKGNEKQKFLSETDEAWLEKYRKNLSSSIKKYIEINGPSFKGKKHTQEYKDKMSEIMKIKSAGDNNSQYGTMWITDGINSKKISKKERIPEGWNPGRKIQSR